MVEKDIVTPLYAQIADELYREIIEGRYGECGCIGIHVDLAQRFSVSLITVRRAVRILEERGAVDIKQGKGTFVRNQSLTDPLKTLTGSTDLLSRTALTAAVSVPVFETCKTPDWFTARIHRELGKYCLHIRRVVSVGSKPWVEANMYLPGKFSKSMTREEVEQHTVYQLYQNKLGINLGRGRQIIRAASALGETAANLGLVEGAPVLQIERRAYDTQKNLIEFMILTYEASVYCFEVEMELSHYGKDAL